MLLLTNWKTYANNINEDGDVNILSSQQKFKYTFRHDRVIYINSISQGQTTFSMFVNDFNLKIEKLLLLLFFDRDVYE